MGKGGGALLCWWPWTVVSEMGLFGYSGASLIIIIIIVAIIPVKGAPCPFCEEYRPLCGGATSKAKYTGRKWQDCYFDLGSPVKNVWRRVRFCCGWCSFWGRWRGWGIYRPGFTQQATLQVRLHTVRATHQIRLPLHRANTCVSDVHLKTSTPIQFTSRPLNTNCPFGSSIVQVCSTSEAALHWRCFAQV